MKKAFFLVLLVSLHSTGMERSLPAAMVQDDTEINEQNRNTFRHYFPRTPPGLRNNEMAQRLLAKVQRSLKNRKRQLEQQTLAIAHARGIQTTASLLKEVGKICFYTAAYAYSLTDSVTKLKNGNLGLLKICSLTQSALDKSRKFNAIIEQTRDLVRYCVNRMRTWLTARQIGHVQQERRRLQHQHQPPLADLNSRDLATLISHYKFDSTSR